MQIENILGSEYNVKHGIPILNTWNQNRHFHSFTIFSFALTPTGRVSKYWCANTFHPYSKIYDKSIFIDVPSQLENRVKNWSENERPKLKSGYKWSNVYAY